MGNSSSYNNYDRYRDHSDNRASNRYEDGENYDDQTRNGNGMKSQNSARNNSRNSYENKMNNRNS